MSSYLNHLVVHICWVLHKITFKGWEDIRQNRSPHTFYWIHEGEGTFRADKSYYVRKGMLAYMKPGFEVSMRSSDESPLVIGMVRFDCAESRYKGSEWGLFPIEELNLPFLQQFSGERAMRVDKLFESLSREWVPSREGGELLAKGSLLAILDQCHRAQASGYTDDSAFRAYELAKAELEQRFHEQLHIRELAWKHSVSPSYLRKMFLKHLGVSPKAYLERIRNDHAVRYLSYSDTPIKTVATTCGYGDEFQFSKTFRKMNGCPPSAFRAAAQQTAPGNGD